MKRLILRRAYPIIYPLMRLWWRLSSAKHEGALVAIYIGQELLLLRSSYRTELNLPGGGLKAGETPEQAARRELREEIGLEVGALTYAGCCSGIWESRRDTCHFFEMHLHELPQLKLDGVEILGAELIAKTQLADVHVTAAVQCYFEETALVPRNTAIDAQARTYTNKSAQQ